MAKAKLWIFCCCVAACVLCVGAALCASLLWARCSSGSFRRAAVAADSKMCSDIGKLMLQRGGSAADGAIAALLCTSVVNPQSMGIGGGSIFIIKDNTGVKVINSRETVPQSFKPDLLKDCPANVWPAIGSQWIGVPGELRGYEAVHRRYGKLPWADLFEPTVRLAREGIALPPFLGKLLSDPRVKGLVQNSSLCSERVLCHKNKTVLSCGDVLRFPKLAETMETVAKQGADAFYLGKIGHDLIEDVQNAGGTLTMEDLKSVQVRVEEAWTVPLGNARMHIPPPPAGGALLGFIVKLMKEFPLTPNSLKGDQKIQMYHHFVEALKFANGQKRNVNDPFFNDAKSADHLIHPSFIRRIKEMIRSNHTHDRAYYLDSKPPPPDHMGTTHVSVLDEDGLSVSATSTINQLFGATLYSPETGIILNNELSDFCGRADKVAAGEQPPSSMTPLILESEAGGTLVIGGSGGSMIPSAVASSLINHLWLGMSLEDAIAAPIVFVDSKNQVNLEPGFDQSVKNGLAALGHKFGNWNYFLNVVNAVEKEKGCITAVSDRRKLGAASGY